MKEQQMVQPIISLIMRAGAGTRLSSTSREGRPKQFLALFGPFSTFQETMRRVALPALFGRSIIVTHHQYRILVAEQLAAISVKADILLEPIVHHFFNRVFTATLTVEIVRNICIAKLAIVETQRACCSYPNE